MSGKKMLPADCVRCGSSTGPVIEVGADCAGWLCPKCYKEIENETEQP